MPVAIEIGRRLVGPGQPCLIIAEAGVNHNGDKALARELVTMAAQCGADAIKFQTFRARALAAPTAPKAAYQRSESVDDETQREMLERLELPRSSYRELADLCAALGLIFLSSPFDEECVDFLEALGMVAFKIPSGEITNLPLLAHVARKGKPIILSTGMSRMEEVALAMKTIRTSCGVPVILLHCVSMYPADPEAVNLRAMEAMAKAFAVPVGYSDHTLGIEVAVAAVARGACVIEKHITLDHSLPGPDQKASIEPAQLKALVRAIRNVEAAMGDGRKNPTSEELRNAVVVRKSVAAACDIPSGTNIRADMLVRIRPGTGISPVYLNRIVGRRARRDIPAGTLIEWEMVW